MGKAYGDDKFLSDDIFGDFLKEVKTYPKLTYNDIYDLFLQYKNGDNSVVDKLLKGHIRLIISIAKEYNGRINNLQMMDLVQEGMIGFMNALPKYDPKISKLSTYATYWIRQAIDRAIKDKEEVIRKPSFFNDYKNRYLRFVDECTKRGENIPEDDEVCKILNISKESLDIIKKSSNLSPVSIYDLVDSDKDRELVFFISDNIDNYQGILDKVDSERLLVVLKSILSPIQYYTIYNHILNKCNMTLEKIGEEFGIIHERVRQIEENALEKIKPYLSYDNPLFNDVIKNYADRNIKIEDVNTLPIEPNKILKFLYLKNELTDDEKKLLFFQFFGELKCTHKIVANLFGWDLKYLKMVLDSLKNKIREKFKDINRFKTYEASMISIYGTKIYDFIYPNFNQLKAFLLESGENCYNKSPYEIEKDIYFTVFGLKEELTLPFSKLRKAFRENTDKFTDEEQTFLKIFFQKKDLASFRMICPHSKLINNHKHLFLKLELLYFKINNLFHDRVTKEMYLFIKSKFSNKLAQRRIKLLDMYFGCNNEPLTILEISRKLDEDYNKIKGEIFTSLDYIQNLYNNRNKDRNINYDIYKPYVLDNKFEFSCDVRAVLELYLIEKLSYEEIAERLGYSKNKITNFVDEGLRRIDYYRFGLIKPDKIDKKVLLDFFINSKIIFDDAEKEIIIAKKLEFLSNSEIFERFGITKPIFDRLMTKFNNAFLDYQTKDISLNEEDIINEINKEDFNSVISREDKIILSLLYGIQNENNLIGTKFSKKDIARNLKMSESAVRDRIKVALNKIRLRKINLIRPELIYMDVFDLNKILDDKHLPISKQKREIICYFFGLKNYPVKSIDEIAKILKCTSGSVKRSYQRAIIDIYKYLNCEISGELNYEMDILPNLKYFSKRDVIFIKESFLNGLSNQEIAEKYNLSINYINRVLNDLKNRLINVSKDECTEKFNFELYRNLVNNPLLPYEGNLQLAKECFDLYTGESTLENYSIPDIIDKLHLECDKETVRRHIISLALSIYKLNSKVKRKFIFTIEEVREYFEKNKNSMSRERANVYINFLNGTFVRSEFSSEMSANDQIRFDLLKDRNPDVFNLENANFLEVFVLLQNYSNSLDYEVFLELIHKFIKPVNGLMLSRRIEKQYYY